MHTVREPRVNPVAIADLRPTQITVGMREVDTKRLYWRNESEKEGGAFLGRHMIPVVKGPKKRLYVIDHHHLALALLQEGVEHVLTSVVSDLSHLDKDAFLVVLDNKHWMHPFDADGKRCDYDAIPRSLKKLADDPYRSLAGALRRAGGFAKDTTPFSDFLWADYLRRRIKRSRVEEDFEQATDIAFALAKEQDANYLPGWCGPITAG